MSDDGQQTNDGAPKGTDTPPETQTDAPNATFTQADVDRIAGDTRQKGRDAGMAEVLKALGVDSLGDAKAMVDAKREADDAAKSDLEKAEAESERLTKELEAAKSEREKLEADMRNERRNHAVLAKLSDAEHPADVLLWLEANKADDLSAAMDDDGAIDDKVVEKLVQVARKERPNFFPAKGPGTPSHSGGKPPTVDAGKIMKDARKIRL
jgi:hypothetical protein